MLSVCSTIKNKIKCANNFLKKLSKVLFNLPFKTHFTTVLLSQSIPIQPIRPDPSLIGTSSSPSEKTIYGTQTTNPSQNNLLGVHRCTHSSSFHYTAKNRKRQKIDQKQNIFYPQFAESRAGSGYLII